MADKTKDGAMGEEQESGLSISRRFLLGDLVKHVMREIQDMQVPWGSLPEKNQAVIIERVTANVKEAVRKVVDLIASEGKVAEKIIIESVTFKDGVKIVAQMGKLAEGRHPIADAAGGAALLVIVDAEKFMKGDPPKPQPDQPDMLAQENNKGTPPETGSPSPNPPDAPKPPEGA